MRRTPRRDRWGGSSAVVAANVPADLKAAAQAAADEEGLSLAGWVRRAMQSRLDRPARQSGATWLRLVNDLGRSGAPREVVSAAAELDLAPGAPSEPPAWLWGLHRD